MKGKLSYNWVLGWSFLSLLLERLWDSFWPVISVAFLFTALALTRIISIFGDTGHLVVLLGFIIAGVLAATRLGKPFQFPTAADAERHIEQANALPHRPLEALKDRPVDGLSPEALTLWQKHQAQMAAMRSKLKIYRPAPDAAKQDRYALRHAAMLALFIGLVAAQGETWPRLREGLQPGIGQWIRLQPVAYDAWITPPDYTGKPAIFLATTQAATAPTLGDITVPENSVLKVRMSGYRWAPRLTYAGGKAVFTEETPRNYTLELPLKESGELKLRHSFRNLGNWKINVTPDNLPLVTLISANAAARSALKITFRTQDDFGIDKFYGDIALQEGQEKPWLAGAPGFDIPAPAGNGTGEKEMSHVVDLTSHPWAGMMVNLKLYAEDAAGQLAESNTESVLLPERKFTNPTAEALIHERKRLIWYNDFLTRRIVSDHLVEAASKPQYYKGDGIVLMGLDMAARRLIYDGDDESVRSVIALLWDLALKIEDGGLSLAARDLSDALQKLSEGLKDKDITQEELQRLTEQVQQKMQEYMQAMASEMQQRLEQGKNMRQPPPEIAQKLMQHIDMGEMLKQLRALTEGNEREQMQKIAEYLKNAVDNLDLNKMDEMREQQMQAMESLQDMQDLINKQQSLMDKTNRLQPGEKSQEAQGEQKQIREKLGDIMRKLAENMPDLPDNFGKADQEMKQASKALETGDNKGAAGKQKQALDQLQQGMDSAIQQMAQGMKQMMLSFGFMPGQGGSGEDYDPLGREEGGKQSGGDIKLPEESERRRVQEIIRELRDRSNDYQRPQVEREYIDRLLDQFY